MQKFALPLLHLCGNLRSASDTSSFHSVVSLRYSIRCHALAATRSLFNYLSQSLTAATGMATKHQSISRISIGAAAL